MEIISLLPLCQQSSLSPCHFVSLCSMSISVSCLCSQTVFATCDFHLSLQVSCYPHLFQEKTVGISTDSPLILLQNQKSNHDEIQTHFLHLNPQLFIYTTPWSYSESHTDSAAREHLLQRILFQADTI